MRKNTYNYNFFNDKSEKSFYWAGFIAADGCVFKIKNTNKFKLQINLSSKDVGHLESFKNDIEYTGKIYKTTRKLSSINKEWNDSEISSLIISLNDKTVIDFETFNIKPRKTKIYTFPKWIIGSNYCNHFIRGYFDGDGCWWKTKNQIRFSMLGTKEFLENCQSIFEDNYLVKSHVKIHKKSSIFTLNYSGNKQCRKIYNYLYNNSTIYLSRKRELVKL